MSEFNNEPEPEELKKSITLKFEKQEEDLDINEDKFYDLNEWYVSKEINTEDDLTYIFLKYNSELKENSELNLNYFGNVVKITINEDIDDAGPIPLMNMDLKSFKKIMEITQILKDIPFSKDNVRFKINKPLMHENFYENIRMEEESTEIDFSTIKNNLETYIENLNNKDLSELANVTNYLDLSDILELICARIAYNIREMDEEKISEEFGN